MQDTRSSNTRRSYFTRSKVATAFKAAGVLPFAIHSGQVLVLIGAEPTRTGPAGKHIILRLNDGHVRRPRLATATSAEHAVSVDRAVAHAICQLATLQMSFVCQ